MSGRERSAFRSTRRLVRRAARCAATRSGGWAPGDEAEAELAGYAAKGFTAAKMRVVGRDGFSISNCVRRVKAARRGLGPNVELMIDAHGSLEVATAIKLAKELEPYDIACFEEPGFTRRSRWSGGGAPVDDNPHRLGRTRVHGVRLPGSTRAPCTRYRPTPT